ncbi:energy transducer TonB [Helicobacter colisuis]|uniref:Energy transducer TonB n=1 Tax=Helicobacter colisuis TaxID=2949739 RepID=A0ABT0TW26_9HELI|nr:energy transducer TonB [Helicobacter colisuis]MCL9820120.1 energy transducer TonB [Helicobacter colisuis]MCL9823533.1 energy transducer TonB [Helicobacter colisuis]
MKTLALQHKPNNSTLQSFLVASGIYAVIFLSLFYGSSYLVPKDIGLQTQTMAISLMHFAQNPAVQKSALQPIQEEIKTPQKPKVMEKPKPIQKAKPIKEKNVQNTKSLPQPKPILDQATHAQPPATPSVSNAQTQAPSTLTFGKVNDPFLLSIKQAIDKNLQYPRKARMLRMAGIVMVEFKLFKNGELGNVKVIQPSKHSLLDRSAIKTILSAGRDFPTPKNDVIIQIPIQYVLT